MNDEELIGRMWVVFRATFGDQMRNVLAFVREQESAEREKRWGFDRFKVEPFSPTMTAEEHAHWIWCRCGSAEAIAETIKQRDAKIREESRTP